MVETQGEVGLLFAKETGVEADLAAPVHEV